MKEHLLLHVNRLKIGIFQNGCRGLSSKHHETTLRVTGGLLLPVIPTDRRWACTDPFDRPWGGPPPKLSHVPLDVSAKSDQVPNKRPKGL